MDKLSELRKALSGRGVKAKIVRASDLSYRTLSLIQAGVNIPLATTRRLIAQALGLPQDYFLEPDPDSQNAAVRRIVIEMDIPQDFRLDEGRLDKIREAMIGAGQHIISVIKDLDKNG